MHPLHSRSPDPGGHRLPGLGRSGIGRSGRTAIASQRQPKRLLLCWEYHRRVWREPFDRLEARHGVALHFLAFRTEDEELPGGDRLQHPRSFWRDYPDARSVIARIEPDEIVFMGLDGAWSIALNHVARRRGIPTVVLHHGALFPPVSAPRHSRRRSRPPVTRSSGSQRGRIPAIRFLLRSMVGRPIALLRVLLWLRTPAAHRSTPDPLRRLESRLPDRYFVTGPVGALVVLRKDGDVADRIVHVGMPEYDALLRMPVQRARHPRALLIDTPSTGTRFSSGRMDPADKAAAIVRLAETMASVGLGLDVKLHPESYGDTWPPEHPNVRIVRDEDPVGLLEDAVVVLGFASTLLAPFLARLPLIAIRTGSWLTEEVARLAAGPTVARLEDITADLVKRTLAQEAATRPARVALARSLLTELDGHALERLAEALGLSPLSDGPPGPTA